MNQAGINNSGTISRIPWATIIDTAKKVTLDPKAFWPIAKAQTTNVKELYLSYLGIIAIIPAVCGLIGLSVVGISMPMIGTLRLPFFSTLFSQIFQYGLSLAMIYVAALVLEKLAPKFEGSITTIDALKLIAYSITPGLLGGVFMLFPNALFMMLSAIAGLYGIYLFWIGLPVMSTVPLHRRGGYFISSLVVMVVIGVAVQLVAQSFRSVPSTMDTHQINFPGIDTKQLEEFNKSMENLQKMLPKGQ